MAKEKKEKAKLKVKPKKEKRELKPISQRKMNGLFIGGLAGFFLLSTTAIALQFISPNNTQSTDVSTEQVKTTDVDYRLQQFLDSYVSAYFTFSSDGETQASQTETLNSYYNFIPEIRSQGQIKQPMTLVSGRLLEILDNIATYQVTYTVGAGDSAQTVTVAFSVPFGGKDGAYYVSGLPWYGAVKKLKAEEVDDSEELKLGAIDEVSESESEELDEFIKLFFTNYTTSQKNLDLVSDGLTTINGASYKTLDYSYYKKSGNKTYAYVQVTLEIAGVTHSENFAFTLTVKDGSYFVKKLEHVIPADYAD